MCIFGPLLAKFAQFRTLKWHLIVIGDIVAATLICNKILNVTNQVAWILNFLKVKKLWTLSLLGGVKIVFKLQDVNFSSLFRIWNKAFSKSGVAEITFWAIASSLYKLFRNETRGKTRSKTRNKSRSKAWSKTQNKTRRITISCEVSHKSYFEIFRTNVTFMVRPSVIVKCKFVKIKVLHNLLPKGTHW